MLDTKDLSNYMQLQNTKFPQTLHSEVPCNCRPTWLASQSQGNGTGVPSPRNPHRSAVVDLAWQ